MPSKLNRAIANKLQAAQVAIFNTLADADLQATVSAFGYDAAKLQQGEQIYQQAMAAVDACAVAWAEQKAATVLAQAARQRTQARYQTLTQTARVIFDEASLAGLGLNRRGGMPRQFAEFLSKSRTLFDSARTNPSLSGPLAAHGLGAEWLDRADEAVNEMVATELAQSAARGYRLRATTLQTAALRDLTVWVATYIKIARIALRDQPALLEKIGVKVRVGRSAAQVAGRQRAAATRRANRAARAAAPSEPIGELGRNLVQ